MVEQKVTTTIRDIAARLLLVPGVTVNTENGAVAITSKAGYEMASTLLGDVIALEREVASTFDPIVKKQRDALTEAQTQRSRHMTPLTGAEKMLKDAMGKYLDSTKVPTLAESISMPPEEAMMPRKAPVTSAVASVRENWEFEVIDQAALIPDLLMPNTTEIRRRVKALRTSAVEACSLAGKKALRVWNSSGIAVRR